MHLPKLPHAHQGAAGPLEVSVDEQYLLIDTESGQLADRSQALAAPSGAAASAPDVITAGPYRAQATVPPQTTLYRLGSALSSRRTELHIAGRENGVSVLPLATFPFETALGRGPASERQLPDGSGTDGTVLCGYRIRVRIPRPDLVPAVTGQIQLWAPVLLALSVNSPWWQGRPSGWASYRAVASGQIRAGAAPVPPGPRDTAGPGWVDFPECDTCLLADDAVVIAGLARAVTGTCLAGLAQGDAATAPAPGFRLDKALEYAARNGISGVLACPWHQEPRPAENIISDLLAYTELALYANDDYERVTLGVEQILRRGTGATCQRQLLSGRGPQAAKLAELGWLAAAGYTG